MPIYEIEAPDGRVFEVEGDREPTQDELTALVRDFKPEPAKAASRGGTIPGFGLYETASRVSDALLSAWDNAGKIGEGAVMAAEAAVEEAKVEAGPLRGALKGAAGALKGAAIVGSAMAPDAGTGLIGFDTSKDPRGGLLYKAGEVVEKLGSTVPAPAQPTFMDDVAEGVGQVVPGIVAAAFTGPAGAFVVGGATEVADAYSREMDRQEKAGEALDFGKAYAKATGYGLAAGAIEARFGAGRIVSRVKDALAGKLRLSGTKELILGRMKDAGVGFTEEAAQRAIQDLIVDGKLDLDAIKQEGGVGAVVQAILGLPAAAIALQPRKAKDIGVEAAASQAERAGLTSVAAAIRESEATLPKDPEAADFEALVSAPIPAVEEQPAPEVQLEVPQEQPQPKAPLENEGQEGQVQEGLLTVEEVPGEAITTEDPGTSYAPATLEQEVAGFLGGESLPESVTVVSEPDGAWAAKLEGGKVVLNAAQIKQGNATKVVLEEGLHGVWDSPELTEAWRGWRQVTDADVAAEREARDGLDTSEDVLREEAAIRRLIENRPADQSFIRKIYEAIRTALRRVFGLEVPNTEQGRAMLEQAAKDYLTRRNKVSQTRFAAPQIKPSKGYFKGDYQTRPDKDVSAEADAFVGQFPTEAEAVAALENPTANVPMDTRAWAVGIIGDRLANRYYQTEDPAEQAAIQKDLVRLAKLGQVEGTEQGQGFRARQRMKDKLAPHSVLLTFFNLINDQQREVIDPIVDVSGVAQGVKDGMEEAGGQAAEKIGKAVKGSQQPKEATKEPEPATKTAKRIVSRLAKSQSDTPSWPAGASDDVEAAVRAQLEQQSPTEAFASVLTGLGVNPDVSAQLSGLVAREIEVRKRVAEAKEDQKAAETIQDSSKIARLLEAAGVQEDVNWSELFQSSAATQEQRQKELFDRIQNDPRFTRLSKAQRAELANTLFKAWELERLRIFRQEFDKLLPGDPETPQKRAVKKILPKLLRYLNLGMLDADAVRNEIARLYGMETFDSDLSNQLKKLSQQAQKLPDGSIQQNQVLDKMHSLMMSRSKLPLDKVLADFWYSNVLGRTSTYLNVLLGTLGTGLWAQTLLSAKVATANMAPGDALRMWQAYFGAIKDAVVAGAHIIYTGDRSVMPGFRKEIDAALSMKDPLKAADTFETIMAKARMEGKPGKLAWAFTQAATKRIMTALDLIGSAGVGDAAKFAAAYNQGNQEAINKLRKRFDKEANKQAETQAREELGTKAPRAVVNARKREILEAGIDQAVLDAADSVRRRAASNAEPHGIGGFLYRTVKPWPFLAKSAAGLQFVRAAANMANWVTDAVPGVGLAKYAQSKLPPKHPLYVNLSKEDQDLAMAAQIAGLAVIAGTAAMFLNDDEEDDGWDISGGWSNLTPQRKKLLRDGGERPYTITTPFGAFNYKQLSGLNAPLALVGTLRDQQKYDKEKWSKETAAAKLFHAWLFGSIGIVKDLNTVSSITDVVGQGAAGTDEALMARVVNFMTRFGSGFIPYRGALGEFDQYSDRRKYMPDKEDVVGAALRNVPFARRAIESGADIDVFGEPIRTPANLLKNWVDITKQPEEWRTLAAMAQKGYWLTEASLGTREIVDPNSGENREMTAKEKVAYAQARGRYIKVLVLEDREALLGMNAKELADYWRSKVSNANKQAMRAAREVASEGQ